MGKYLNKEGVSKLLNAAKEYIDNNKGTEIKSISIEDIDELCKKVFKGGTIKCIGDYSLNTGTNTYTIYKLYIPKNKFEFSNVNAATIQNEGTSIFARIDNIGYTISGVDDNILIQISNNTFISNYSNESELSDAAGFGRKEFNINFELD